MKKSKQLTALILSTIMLVSSVFAGSILAQAESADSELTTASSDASSVISSGENDASGASSASEAGSSSLPAETSLPNSSTSVAEPPSSEGPIAFSPMPASTTHTVNFLDWDSTLLITQEIDDGTNAVPPSNPTRDGYSFTGWSPDPAATLITSPTNFYAQYTPLLDFTITINYTYANSTIAAQSKIFDVASGSAFTQSITSPTIAGYNADQPVLNISIPSVSSNHTYTVVYTPSGNTAYKVEHYQQNLAQTGYDLIGADTQNLTGQTGALVGAAAKSYPGFAPPATMPTAKIAGDGSTVLKVYYTRNQYAVYYNTGAGATFVPPVAAIYGAPISLPAAPSRLGYTFTGWSPASLPATMPANDITLTALWAPKANTNYTLVHWLENVTSTGYDYVATTVSTGTTGTAPVTPSTIPGGVTFPIPSGRFTLNTTKTNAEKPAAINGDGTTIVNVYYDRNSYTLSFTFDATKYKLVVGGTTYTSSPYTLTAKYGASINAKWPGAPSLLPSKTSDGNFIGWEGQDGTFYVTTQYFMNDSVISATPLAASWDKNTKNITISYFFQNINGVGYTENTAYRQTVAAQKDTDSWYAKVFAGFTVKDSIVEITGNSASFEYDRNKYSITYYNGNNPSTTTSNIYYQTDISGPTYNTTLTDANRPSNIPAGYTFAGWYTTPEGYDASRFNFTGATMPAYNLILYARWDKPQYTVTFAPNNGSANFTQTVPMLSTATEPTPPTKPGYVFTGWYANGSSLRYVFNFPVNSSFTLTAGWVATNNISYDVVYKIGTVEYQRQTFGGKTIGDNVSASAISIPGYLPDAPDKNLILAATGNEIVFTYTPFTSVGYTVHYWKAGTTTELAPDKTSTSSQASVTENYKNIPGFYPDYYQKTMVLTPNAANNVLTFYYTENALSNYTVRIFKENLGGGYTSTDIPKTAPAGSTASETPPSYPGFTFQPGLSANNRVVASDGSTVIRLYYNRDRFTVNFAVASGSETFGSLSGQASFPSIPYETQFQNAVTVPTPVANPGYKFSSWAPAIPAGSTTITADATYEAAFEKDASQWGIITFDANRGGDSGTGAMPNSPETIIGTSYTLPANTFTRDNHTFIGWNTHPNGDEMDYEDGETLPFPGTVTLYAQWVENPKFALTYMANGGTGSIPTLSYFVNTKVDIAHPGSMSKSGYNFRAWNTQADGLGTVYFPEDELTITANTWLYAEWEYDNTQWTTIKYLPNGADGSTPMPDETVLGGTSHNLAANAYSRANYTFLGWNTDEDATTALYSDGQSITTVTNTTLTLYAIWAENPKFTVTYNSNNPAAETQADPAVYSNTEITIRPANTFSYTHYDFARWNTQPDGNGDSYIAGSTLPLTQNLVLYAVWKERRHFDVIYHAGFTGPADVADPLNPHYVDADGTDDVTVIANPFSRPGYTFVDWISNENIIALPSTVIYDVYYNIEFTAEWAPITYNITYNLNGGGVAGSNPTQYTIETPSFTLINPTKPGYTFAGWDDGTPAQPSLVEIVGTGSMGDLTYTATWQKDPSQWSTISFVNSDAARGTLSGTTSFSGIIGQPTADASVAFPTTSGAYGYTFSHWSQSIPSSFPAQNTTIMAFWAPVTPTSLPPTPVSITPSSQPSSSSKASSRSVSSVASSSSSSTAVSSAASSSASASSSSSSSSSAVVSSVPSSSTPPSSSVASTTNSGFLSDFFTPFGGPNKTNWALVNLLAAILGVVLSVLLFVGLVRPAATEADQEKRKKSRVFRISAIITGVVSAIVFLFTENIFKHMVIVDEWTIFMLLLAALQLLLIVFMRRQNNEKN